MLYICIVSVCVEFLKMKLLIADDHTLFRDALVQYIERAVPTAQITLAKDLHEAVDRLNDGEMHDLVVLDLKMPGMNGIQGFKNMKEKFPNQPVALMSGVAEEEDIQAALEAGAVGYFPKTISGKAFLKAIQYVLDGGIFRPQNENQSFIPSYYADTKQKKNDAENASMSSNDFKLTPRETEILGYLADGASNKDIANVLNLQIVTIKLHVRGICRKLGAKNRTQAALKAKDIGIEAASQKAH